MKTPGSRDKSTGHPIRVAAERTGVSTHLIRAWELRYKAIEPHRSPTDRRLYSDAQINRIRLLKQGTEQGHTISHLARLEDLELERVLNSPEIGVTDGTRQPIGNRPPEPMSREVDRSIERLDGPALTQALDRLAVKVGYNRCLEVLWNLCVDRTEPRAEHAPLRSDFRLLASILDDDLASRSIQHSRRADGLSITVLTLDLEADLPLGILLVWELRCLGFHATGLSDDRKSLRERNPGEIVVMIEPRRGGIRARRRMRIDWASRAARTLVLRIRTRAAETSTDPVARHSRLMYFRGRMARTVLSLSRSDSPRLK